MLNPFNPEWLCVTVLASLSVHVVKNAEMEVEWEESPGERIIVRTNKEPMDRGPR